VRDVDVALSFRTDDGSSDQRAGTIEVELHIVGLADSRNHLVGSARNVSSRKLASCLIEKSRIDAGRFLVCLKRSGQRRSCKARHEDENSRVPDLLELAGLFNEISALGEAERKACLQVLNVFAEYRRSSSSSRRFR